ncbi:MAG: hypothetical protein ABIL58_20960 [Pseudomonadota bacterium]
MIRSIHRTPKFDKCLAGLEFAGKKAAVAAGKARDIIDGIARYGSIPPKYVAETTKHGERRIRNCVKYDLGGGYRMVTVKREAGLHLVFIGTHDEVQRWIQNKKNRRIEVPDENLPAIEASAVDIPIQAAFSPPQDHAHSDFEDLSVVPDDRLLRRIFCGIAGCAADRGDR